MVLMLELSITFRHFSIIGPLGRKIYYRLYLVQTLLLFWGLLRTGKLTNY